MYDDNNDEILWTMKTPPTSLQLFIVVAEHQQQRMKNPSNADDLYIQKNLVIDFFSCQACWPHYSFKKLNKSSLPKSSERLFIY